MTRPKPQKRQERDSKGRWAKGRSGNPRGRRRERLHISDAPADPGPLPDAEFARLVADCSEPKMRQIARRLVDAAKDGDRQAIEMVLRLRESASRKRAITAAAPHDLSRLTTDEIKVMRALLARASGSADDPLAEWMITLTSRYERETKPSPDPSPADPDPPPCVLRQDAPETVSSGPALPKVAENAPGRDTGRESTVVEFPRRASLVSLTRPREDRILGMFEYPGGA